jgi:hypothetical protein
MDAVDVDCYVSQTQYHDMIQFIISYIKLYESYTHFPENETWALKCFTHIVDGKLIDDTYWYPCDTKLYSKIIEDYYSGTHHHLQDVDYAWDIKFTKLHPKQLSITMKKPYEQTASIILTFKVSS